MRNTTTAYVLGLAVLIGTPALAQNGPGHPPPEMVKRWQRAFDVMQKLSDSKAGAGYFVRAVTGSSFSYPRGEELAAKLAECKKWQNSLGKEARQLAAEMEKNWGPKYRGWDRAQQQKFGKPGRTPGGSRIVVYDPGKNSEGRALQPDYYYENLKKYADALETWEKRILDGWQEDLDEAIAGTGHQSHSIDVNKRKSIGSGEWKVENQEWTGVKFFLEQWTPVAKVLAEYDSARFGKYPEEIEKRAEVLRKQRNDMVDKYELPKGMTPEQFGDGYDDCLAAAYDYFASKKDGVLHVRISEGWETNARNLIGEPMQHHIEVYAVCPHDEDKDLAYVMWTNLYTPKARNVEPKPPFDSTGSSQYYLMRISKAPDNDRPGGFMTFVKIVFSCGCCLIFLAILGGGGYFGYMQMQKQKAAAGGAAPAAGGAAPAAPPAGGAAPAAPPAGGAAPTPPTSPPAGGAPPPAPPAGGPPPAPPGGAPPAPPAG